MNDIIYTIDITRSSHQFCILISYTISCSIFINSEEQRLTLCTRKPLSSTTYLIFNDQMRERFLHLKLHGYFPCHLRDFLVANVSNIRSAPCDRSSWYAQNHHLCSRGYPRRFLRAVFQEVTWIRRSELLKGSRRKKSNEFFETYRACVLTLRNAPEWPTLKELLDLNLNELTESTFGDIFPPRVFLAQSSAPRLGSILKR